MVVRSFKLAFFVFILMLFDFHSGFAQSPQEDQGKGGDVIVDKNVDEDGATAPLVPRLVEKLRETVSGERDDVRLCDVKRQLVFGGLDWDSAALTTDIVRVLLEQGYGCSTRVERGSLHTHLNAMRKGEVDIVLEVWPNQESVLWDALTKEKVVVAPTTVFDDGVEGWFVPSYVVNGPAALAPGLKSVFDLERFAAVFQHGESAGRGVFINCVETWDCAGINAKKLRSYALHDDYDDYRPASGVEFFSVIEQAIKARRPVLFYMWGPSWVIGKYDLVRLEEPEYDGAVWASLLLSDTPERVSAYPPVRAELAVNAGFYDGAPQVSSVLSRAHFSSQILSVLLAQMQRDKLTLRETAVQFLKQHRTVWRDWVQDDARVLIEAYLAQN